MPTIGKARRRTSAVVPASTSRPRRTTHHRTFSSLQPEQESEQPSQHFQVDSQPPGRIRQYLPPDDPNSEWNQRSPETPEGRLSGLKESDWSVPQGDEPYLRDDDGSRSGSRSGNGEGQQYDKRYRAEDFHVATINSYDHQVTISVPMTREMLVRVQTILRSKRLPFSSRENFVNVAVFELIQICNRLEPLPDSHIAVLESMNDLNHNFKVMVDYDYTIRQSCRVIHDLVEQRLKNNARIMVHDLLRDIQRIKSREVREKHRKRVVEEFGSLIGEAKPVSGRPVRTNKKRR